MSDEPKLAHIDVAMTPELWGAIHSGPVPDTSHGIEVLQQRTLNELRSSRRYKETEVDYVARSPEFQASSREAYFQTVDRMQRKHSLPSKVRITYPVPGTREAPTFWNRRSA